MDDWMIGWVQEGCRTLTFIHPSTHPFIQSSHLGEPDLATFAHFGVPTKKQQPGENYLEGAKVYITDPEKHPFKVEFVRCEEGCPLPEPIQTTPHAAFIVDDIQAAVKGCEIILPPTKMGEDMSIAFIRDGDALIELMQMK